MNSRQIPLPDDLGRIPGPVGPTELRTLYEQNRAPVSAVPTMLPTWNKLCRDEGGGVGLAHGWHIVVGGKTGSGKSLFALNMAVEAMKRGNKVAYLSLEMSKRQLLTRALAIVSEVPIWRLEPGADYHEGSFGEATEIWGERLEDRMYVTELPIQTLEEIEVAIVKAHELCDVRFFITDYMQLAWTSKAETLTAQITEVSHMVRGLAQELKVVSIGLSQYNRATSSAEQRPDVTGLMGGSSLENDADQVILLDHTTYKKASDKIANQEILLAKNRHGSSGRLAIQWDYRTLRVLETVDGTDDDDEIRLPY